MGLSYFFNDYAPACERWILADNSQIPFKVVAEGAKGQVTNIRDEKTYNIIKSLVNTDKATEIKTE